MKRLDLIVGPNGSGKSTFVAETLSAHLPQSVFVNADIIARDRWPEAPEASSYEAAKIAESLRTRLIDAGRSFIAETVFSHPSKLELITQAQRAGFIVVVHVMIVPEELAVQRVRQRVRAGGHAVPEVKIRQRYVRLWPFVATSIARSDEATVYDTAGGVAPRVVAEFFGGETVGRVRWPVWTPEPLVSLVP
ncbi:AAA family ATPase [Williamsia sp.]|uniref:AAA family ATPase n=1 Tax=Williamsia sp. TaxID=1872085 RepID=UPI002F926A4C